MSNQITLPPNVLAVYGEQSAMPFASREEERAAFSSDLYKRDAQFRAICELRLALGNPAADGTKPDVAYRTQFDPETGEAIVTAVPIDKQSNTVTATSSPYDNTMTLAEEYAKQEGARIQRITSHVEDVANSPEPVGQVEYLAGGTVRVTVRGDA